jgi:hypothetical protein
MEGEEGRGGRFPLGGLVALLVGLAAIGGLLYEVTDDSGSPVSQPPAVTTSDPAGTSTTTAATTTSRKETAATCEFKVDRPPDFKRVQPKKVELGPRKGELGVLVAGTACDDDLVWLFDYDREDKYYYPVSEGPIRIDAEKWAETDSPIGDSGDPAGTIYTIVAVNASEACSNRLKAAKPKRDGDIRFRPLPRGCPDGSKELPGRVVRIRIVKAG